MLGWFRAEAASASRRKRLRACTSPATSSGKKLERHKTLQPGVLGLIDHAHTAATEFLDNAVVRDRRVDHYGGVQKGCLMIGPKELSVNFRFRLISLGLFNCE